MRSASTLARLAVVLVAAVLAGGAVAASLHESAARRARLAAFDATRLAGRHPELRPEIAHAADLAEGDRALSRALVYEGLSGGDDGAIFDLGADVDLARSLAARALAARPASAEAAMLLGLATRLGLESRRDPALYARRDTWEAPLRVATRLAPGDPEPRRALAGSMLSIWFAISGPERDAASGLLREAFLDPGTFERLIGSWVRAAWRPEVVFSIMPDAPAAWDRLESIYAGARAWPAWRDTHARRLEVLRRDLDRRLAEAGRQLETGNPRAARLGFI